MADVSHHASATDSRPDPFNRLRPRVHRLSGWRWLLFHPINWLLLLWMRSWRVKLDAASASILRNCPAPRLILTWHSRSLLMPRLLQRVFPGSAVHCLISPSKAAAWEVAFFESWGMQAIRGSSSRRGVQAMLEMRRALRDGNDVAISPDGPVGPAKRVQHGAIRLAKAAKVPVVLCFSSAQPALRLRTWDRHLIPLPGATIHCQIQLLAPEHALWQQPDAAVAAAIESLLDD
jgi:lysophospholipid acyltransferase (LPLAT)-like uncharacterized protein